MLRTAVAAVGVLSLAAPVLSGAAEDARPIRSLREIRQQDVVIQRWDLSCGSAALSTLLTYDYSDPVSEALIVTTILHRSDPVRIRARGGFSLLDLKRFAQGRGYQGVGYARLDVASLLKLVPAIVPTRLGGYDHFLVVRGIREGRMLLADPAYGNRTMPLDQFEAAWPTRVAFVIRKPGRSATRIEPPPYLVVPRTLVRDTLARFR